MPARCNCRLASYHASVKSGVNLGGGGLGKVVERRGRGSRDVQLVRLVGSEGEGLAVEHAEAAVLAAGAADGQVGDGERQLAGVLGREGAAQRERGEQFVLQS